MHGLGLNNTKMSGYYYPPSTSAPEGEEFNLVPSYQMPSSQPQQPFQTYSQVVAPALQQRPSYTQAQALYSPPQPLYSPPQPYQQQFSYQPPAVPSWMTPTVPSNYPIEPQRMVQFPRYSEPPTYSPEFTPAGPSRTSTGYLSPDEADTTRVTRSSSFASNASSARSYSQSDVSRDVSPNASEMAKWGFRNVNGTWSCAYPGCSSRSTFSRGCDLRKHYKRHTKSLFCRHEGCPQATDGGFSSKKDRVRHEAKHNPMISCEWEGCDRLFSRVDNMVGLL